MDYKWYLKLFPTILLPLLRRLYCWGSGDGGWLGLNIPPPLSLPLVEPGPPMDKFGPTRAFDSDYNALLPEMVMCLSRYRVVKAVGGAGHTIFLVGPEVEGKGEEESYKELEGGMRTLALTDEGREGRMVAASKGELSAYGGLDTVRLYISPIYQPTRYLPFICISILPLLGGSIALLVQMVMVPFW